MTNIFLSQGFHNVSPSSQVLRDPTLTPLGVSQCQALCLRFPRHDKIDLLVASPMKRTLYTALVVFAPVLKAHPSMKVVALPQLQETSSIPCDTGSSRAELEKEFEGCPIDFSLVTEDWNSKIGKWGTTDEIVAERALEARQWLRSRPEKEIVAVAHGGFLHHLTQEWTGSEPFKSNVPSLYAKPGSTEMEHLTGSGWDKCELRTFAFVDELDVNATIKETKASIEKRQHKGNLDGLRQPTMVEVHIDEKSKGITKEVVEIRGEA